MKDNVNTILEKTAAYVEATQTELDKAAEAKDRWNTETVKTAAVLANRGIIDSRKVDQFADKLAEDPAYALTFLEKVASMVEADSLGKPSKITKIASNETDGFTRELFPELINNSNALID